MPPELTVNKTPLLATPPTVTTTLPVVAPVGTAAAILVALQDVIAVAAVPLKVTVLVPFVAPKVDPAITMDEPIIPLVGDRLVMAGGVPTVKALPLLATPPTVTTTLPVVVPVGATAVILVALHDVIVVAAVPLKVTVLVPGAAPKADPAITTDEPMIPLAGDKLVIAGGVTTVKLTPLLARPPTVTTTLPVVAPVGTTAVILVTFHDVIVVAAVPLKVTVPWVAPKLDPEMTTDEPIIPLVGDRLVIAGGVRTVKLTPLLATPPTVTTTLPVVAPVGTTAVTLVSLHKPTVVAVTPLNCTVPVPCVAPKLVPEIVTDAPTGPSVGERLFTPGVTRKIVVLLLMPFTVTVTPEFPAGNPLGILRAILVSLQDVGVTVIPPITTVLVP
jgi:hypothetical protein